MEFLTSSEKLKELRKKLGMKQHDLGDENLTRGLISMIELGKRSVTRENARILTNKFRVRANELGIELDIDDDYLLRNSYEEAEYYCMKKLRNNPSKEEIEVVVNIAEKFQLEIIKAEAFKVLADMYYDKGEYDDSFLYYINSLDFYNKIQDISSLAYIYNRLGTCKVEKFEYLVAIVYFNKAYFYSSKIEDKVIFKKALYNLGRCYKLVKKYDQAIQYLSELLNYLNVDSEYKHYAYTYILIANCYNLKGNINRAISIYNELINLYRHKDEELLGYIYNNLGDLYLKIGNLEESIKYFNFAEEARKSKYKTDLASTYINKAEVFIKKGEYNTALELISKSLNMDEQLNDVLRLKAYYTLCNTYILMDDRKNLKEMLSNIASILIKYEEKKEELIKIYSKLACLALEEKDYNMCEKYLLMIQNI